MFFCPAAIDSAIAIRSSRPTAGTSARRWPFEGSCGGVLWLLPDVNALIRLWY